MPGQRILPEGRGFNVKSGGKQEAGSETSRLSGRRGYSYFQLILAAFSKRVQGPWDVLFRF